MRRHASSGHSMMVENSRSRNAQETAGVSLGRLTSAWGKFVAPVADESGSRALMFGGYRWRNDLALEAAFGSSENYSLMPYGHRGIGLSLAGPADTTAQRSWNADIYTSWTFKPSFALYGRLGYIQSENSAGFAPAPISQSLSTKAKPSGPRAATSTPATNCSRSPWQRAFGVKRSGSRTNGASRKTCSLPSERARRQSG